MVLMVGEMNQTDFQKDIERGKVGEHIFKIDFLEFLDIEYEDITGCQKFQAIDIDFKAKIGLYEIKSNYKDDKQLCIEEYTNINESLCPVSMGWFYKTKADLVVFVSKKTQVMVFVPFNDKFREYYEFIKEDYKLIWNRISVGNGRKWQSAFRRIPLETLKGYYSMYKRIK